MNRFWLQTTLSGLVLMTSVFNVPVMIDQVDLASKPVSPQPVDLGQVAGASDSNLEQPSPILLKPSQVSPSSLPSLAPSSSPLPSLAPRNELPAPSPSTKSQALLAATKLKLTEVEPTKVEALEPMPVETEPTFNISQVKLTNHHPDYLTLSWQDESVKAEAYQVRFSVAPITVQNWAQAELAEVVFPVDRKSLMLDQEHFLLLRKPDLKQGYLGISLIDGAKSIFGLGQKLIF